jgi:hypothetical protein
LTVCLIGITRPDDRYRVRTLHRGEDPEHLIPLLQQIHRDADDWPCLVRHLLDHNWRELDTEARHHPTAVPGIGYTAPEDTAAPLDGRISDPVPINLTWLYLIDLATDTLVVYEATRRERWLLHSLHRLNQHHGELPRPAQQPNAAAAAAPSPPAAALTRQSAAPLSHLTTNVSYRDVEDLTNGIRRGSIVLDPPYQRGSVWSTDQRVALMRSWLTGVPVAAITLNNRMGRAWYAIDPHARIAYAVVDGRQRLETALAWEDGALAIPASWLPRAWIEHTEDTDNGPYVRNTGLTEAGRRSIQSRMTLPCVQARLPDVESEAELYLLVNGAGTPQSHTDLSNAARIAGR